MSISMPPLLFGLAYSRLGRNGSRDVDLNTSGMPMRPSSICFFAGGVAGVEPAHESHLEEHAGRARSPSCIAATSSSDSAGGFSQNVGFFRAAAAITSSRCVCVGRDDDDRRRRRIVDERQRIRVVPRHVELRRDLLRQRRHGIGDGDEPRFRECGSPDRARRRGRGGPTPISPTASRAFASRRSVISRVSLVTSSSFDVDVRRERSRPRITLTRSRRRPAPSRRETAPPTPPSSPPRSPSSHRRARRSR